MTKSIRRNVIVSALLAICLCASLIAGATFAIFTSESKVNIAVTSGNLKQSEKRKAKRLPLIRRHDFSANDSR